MEQETSEELRRFRAEVAEWLQKNKPEPPSFKLPQSFMEVETEEQFRYLQDWQRKVYEAGYLGLTWPEEYGGYGQPQVRQDIVNEEMERLRVPFMLNSIGLAWAGPTIVKLGSEVQKKKYIKKILTAEEIWCQGFSEPDHGSDLASLQTRAERQGDFYLINGRKIWSSLADFSDHMILLARTDPNAPNRYLGLSFFLCPMNLPGIEIRRIRKMTGEYGFSEVIFDNVALSADCLVGEEGQGWMIAMATLTFERGATGGQAGGHLREITDTGDVLELARVAMRDGKPAIDDPVVRDQLVSLMILERILRLNRKRLKVDGLNRDRPAALWLMMKVFASEYIQELSEFAVVLQGAKGTLYMDDPNALAGGMWQRAYMNSFSATIGGGTSEVQRNIIGERLLGLPKG